MNRRAAIFKLFAGLKATTLGAMYLNFFSSTYRVVIVNYTKNLDSSASSSNEFWAMYGDAYAEHLNQIYMNDGRLLNVTSYLGKDGKSAVLIKHYRSKQDHLDYVEHLNKYHQSISYTKKTFSKEIIA